MTPPDLEALETVADWRADLTARIKRAYLVFQLADVDGVDVDALATEVAAFKKVCACLAWRSKEEAAP